MTSEQQQQTDLQSKIITELESNTKSSSKASTTSSMDVKTLRKIILLQLQTDTDDKNAKKQYKKAIKALESNDILTLDENGLITFLGKKSSSHSDEKKNKKEKKDKKKKKKKDKKDKKRGHNDDEEDDEQDGDADGGGGTMNKKQKVGDENDDNNDDDNNNNNNDDDDNDNDAKEEVIKTETNSSSSSKKNKPCKGNPLGVTRLFIGNLPFKVDETSLQEFVSPAIITHIKWITDKETGKFYGSSFVEMENSVGAASAVKDKNGEKLMGRPLKINFAPAREGDAWPPKKREITGNGNGGVNGGQAGGTGVKAMSAKPDDCVKLFIGNLSFDIDDDTIVKFFGNVDAEVKAVRWLHHKDSGDFKGCGYVEFWNTEACEKAAALNGKSLMNRPIRIDWTD